ncbi:hypothetical protein VOLCADRAFT_108654 [Volvox carteri f. nagariensis]|uniref:Uncharacterized protein n=1 Tax=Volvox carteri f. nagariensis TaxID=3068 RepID=D8ULL4_VOLCA|nr:uncharacterized protein VOLCADRAFT_108654 [Volvox carteri f. nagariensis]EFJ39385.1 hypothetical protein VOLCADRAFT_108654 [Volvox carteri f. nagariensis]|eukprot:XP_002959549.1 hypothetical protein VOLCADRAFT_108654 [Volvox carteri f. nagariensis]
MTGNPLHDHIHDQVVPRVAVAKVLCTAPPFLLSTRTLHTPKWFLSTTRTTSKRPQGVVIHIAMGPAGDHERVAIMAKKKKLPTSFPPHTRWAVWDTTVFIEGMGSLRFILVSNEAEVWKAGGGQNLMVVNQVAEEVQKQATPLLKRVVHGWLKERPHLKQYTTNDSMLLCRLKAIKAIHSSTPSVKLASCTAMAKALRRSAELAPVASAIKELKLKRPPLSATSPRNDTCTTGQGHCIRAAAAPREALYRFGQLADFFLGYFENLALSMALPFLALTRLAPCSLPLFLDGAYVAWSLFALAASAFRGVRFPWLDCRLHLSSLRLWRLLSSFLALGLSPAPPPDPLGPPLAGLSRWAFLPSRGSRSVLPAGSGRGQPDAPWCPSLFYGVPPGWCRHRVPEWLSAMVVVGTVGIVLIVRLGHHSKR